MAVDLALHPQYQVKAAKYNADKSAATTAGDQGAIAIAESEWAQARAEMQMELVNRQETEMTRQARLNAIKTANPLVPESVFEAIPDLDAAQRVAESFQKLAAERPNSAAAGSWSPPAGTSGSTGSAEIREEDMTPDQREEKRIKRMDEIAPNVMKRGALAREENEELQRLSLEPLTAKFQR